MAGIESFGTTAAGAAVARITIAAGGLTVAVLTWGAVLQSVRLAGVGHDLTLGSDRLSDYEGAMAYHGSLIAPVANRIGGARAPFGAGVLHLPANEGANCLHSGPAGTQEKVWTLAAHGDDFVTLTCDLPDGEGGLPGNRRLTARFSVAPPATLRLEVTATTDAPTLMNVANHSYWTMDGGADWSGHRLQIAADHWLPTDAALIPTGEIVPTAGSAMDFAAPRTITPGAPALDTCFCLAPTRRALTPVLWLTGASGLAMELATTEPGVQVYDGRQAIRPGRGPCEGLAIEPQFWPDAPNRPGFPPIRLDPGQPWEQISEWRFKAV